MERKLAEEIEIDVKGTLLKADHGITQALGALMALKSEENDLAKVIDDLRDARVSVLAVASARWK